MNQKIYAMTITEIYNKYYTQTYNAVRQMVKDEHETEDLVSMVFVKVNRYLHSFDETKASFDTWLYKITQSVVFDFFRTTRKKNNRFTAVSDFSDSEGNNGFEFVAHTHSRADDIVLRKELKAEIIKAFKTLKPQYKQIMRLYLINDKPYAEIAEMLEIPLGTVKGTVNKCRGLLQKQLKKTYATYK